MSLISELQAMRRQVDTLLGQMIQMVEESTESNINSNKTNGAGPNYESQYPLLSDPGIFKGKKPTGITFENGDRISVGTWKKVFAGILESCITNVEYHVALMNLRGKISGRERILLASEKDNMRSPLKIAENLYIETHYDTETLLRILTTRILTPIGYDYSKIIISVRNS
jgi:hypothetical protein